MSSAINIWPTARGLLLIRSPDAAMMRAARSVQSVRPHKHPSAHERRRQDTVAAGCRAILNFLHACQQLFLIISRIEEQSGPFVGEMRDDHLDQFRGPIDPAFVEGGFVE